MFVFRFQMSSIPASQADTGQGSIFIRVNELEFMKKCEMEGSIQFVQTPVWQTSKNCP